MKASHTPGPWTTFLGIRSEISLGRIEKVARCHAVIGPNGLPVAEMHIGAVQANARLIAAAPEMLEALKILARAWQREHGSSFEKVDALIARIEGGGE